MEGLSKGELLALLAGLLVAAAVGARMLGVRRSWLANLGAGVAGWILGLGIAVVADGGANNPNFVPDALLLAFLMTMAVAVVMDLLARPGTLARGNRAGLVTVGNPLRAVGLRIDALRRSRELIAIARRHGFGPYLGVRHRSERQAERTAQPVAVRAREAIEEAGGVIVKVGQVASTRTDLLPPEVIAELRKLQSAVPPVPDVEARAVLEESLGARVEDVFADFQWDAVSAASIGQVYFATLRTGEEVVVKVRKPGIVEEVDRDLNVLGELASLVERTTAWAAQLHVRALFDEFARSVREELDFAVEAQRTLAIGEDMVGVDGIRVPRVFDELSSTTVLVQERLFGADASDPDAVERFHVDRTGAARSLLRGMSKQLLVTGHFHADPHPGNVLLLGASRVGLIDFGATGRLDQLEQASLRSLLAALATRNPTLLQSAVSDLVVVPPTVDDETLARALSRFVAVHLSHGSRVSAGTIEDLFRLLTTFGIVVPSELTAFGRSLVTLEGTLNVLAPGFDLVGEVAAMVPDLLGGEEPPKTAQDAMMAELVNALPSLRKLPDELERISRQLARGELTVRVSRYGSEEERSFVRQMVGRVTLAALAGLLGIVSVLLVWLGPLEAAGNAFGGLRVLGLLGLVGAAALGMRVVAAVVRDGPN